MKPNFKDVKEISDEEFQKIVDKERETRNITKYGRDGIYTVWEKTYQYRGIKYNIIFLRYYQIDIPVNETTGWNQYQRHFVLEPPKETEKFTNLSHNDEFLYRDTNHIWNQHQSLKEMFDEMVRLAHQDIDDLLDNIPDEKEKHIRKVQREILFLRKHALKYPK